MSSLDKIAKAGFIVFLGIGFERFFGYLFRMLVARVGVEVYGLYSLGVSLVLTFVSISMLGLMNGLIRFVSFHAGKKNKPGVAKVVSSTIKVTLPLSIFFMILVFLFSKNLAHFFNEPRLSHVLKVFSVLIPVWVMLNVYVGINTAFKRMGNVVFVKNLLNGVSRIFFLVVFLYMGFGLNGVLVAQVFSITLAFICLFYLTKSFFKFSFTKGFDRELFSYSWPAMFTAITLGLSERVDTLMIAYFRDTIDVALYNTAYPTAALLLIVPTAILSIFLPTITGKHAKKQGIDEDYKTVTRWIMMLNLPLATLMIFYSHELLELLFTVKYVSAAPALSILGILFLTESLTRPSTGILLMYKRTKLILALVLLGFFVTVVLGYLLIPDYGIIGAALATGIGRLVVLVIISTTAYKLTKTKIFDVSSIKSMLSISLSAVFVYFLDQFTLLNFPTLIALLLLSYILLLFATKVITKEDKEIIRSIFRILYPAGGQ